ncbi:MAG: potassium-transporting ATPase subunit KdpA [Thermoplasmata archaeon]|nr:potassium-transporting ATPase subunit KdpA [Thermoplasmata archaeon]MCI4359267.1 potassium-transporting ATPase subunit KdpA [Thermoplasmata archaeon]
MIPTGTVPEIVLTLGIAIALAPLFGRYLANVYSNGPSVWDPIVGRVERAVFWIMGVDPRRPMTWSQYAKALLLTDGIAIGFVFVLLQLQSGLPNNALGAPSMSWHLAFHTSIAFGTNTDFQHYVPEEQASLLSSLFGLQLLMFTSPATGLCVFAAMARGFSRKDGRLGNYYSDFVRTLTRVLVPVTVLGAIALVLLGVPETLTQTAQILPLTGGHESIPLGPVASWDSIEFLGTNGGGFFTANAAHPFQDPTSATNFVAILLMLSIPLASPFAFARLVRRPGEATPLFATILTIFLAGFIVFLVFEGSNHFLPVTVNQGAGYLVGAETRFSISESALFQFSSVYSNTGATNMALGSLTPLSQTVLMFGMFMQSTPGGVGTGFGTLLINVVLAVFMGGLMVGRSPEYLGKKIGMPQVKWAAAAILSHPFSILIPTALAMVIPGVLQSAIGGYTPHGFTVLLYEFSSESANNGSGMGPINDGTMFFNVAGALVMAVGRYFPAVAMLAIAGSLAQQEPHRPGPGTLKTRSVTFWFFLVAFIVIVTGLLFLPVLALGPFSQMVGGP